MAALDRLDADALLTEAVAQSGVEPPARLDVREALDRLVAGFNANARMHAAGREKARGLILDHLTTRLRAERYWLDHPEIQDAPVVEPVFVMGMPRTGSTLLVNLFDRDPRWRTLLKWQVMEPVPPADADAQRTDPRCLAQIAREKAAFGAGANPNIHFERADSPAECVQLHMQDFRAQGWDAYAGDPDYSDYLLTTDLEPTYRWHKKMLQILQSKAPGRWMLKAPSHALYADSLLKVYPDARLIWTHRDPLVAVASHLSLIANVHRRYTDTPDLAWIADFYPRQLALHVEHAAAAKARRPQQVLDLHYDELTTAPFATLERAYRWLDVPLDPPAREAAQRWLEENPQGKFGEHRYALEEYGLTTEQVTAQFADYIARHQTGRRQDEGVPAHA